MSHPERLSFLNKEIPAVVFKEHLLRYVRVLDQIERKRVLDLGCGTGYGAFLMSFLAIGVVGVDYDHSAIEEMLSVFGSSKTMGYAMADLQNDDDISVLKALGKFDVITCFEVIEHMKDPEKMLAAARDMLEEGGKIFISTPNAVNLTDENEWHLTPFNVQTLTDLVSKYFNNVKVSYMNGNGFCADAWQYIFLEAEK